MKKFILWLIKVFHLDIPTEVNKFVHTESVVTYCKGDTEIPGDLKVKGNLLVSGT